MLGTILIIISVVAIAVLSIVHRSRDQGDRNWRKIRTAIHAIGWQRYSKKKATIACNAGRGRHIQMSDSVWTILGKRWTLSILKIIGSREPVRFNEIKKALAGISSTMLTERLLELEYEGLVLKNSNGSKIEYSLTNSARELEFILIRLDRWWSEHHRTYQPLIAN